MAAKLKNLKVKKVDFVDEGANPEAHIKMIKKKDGEKQISEEDSKKKSENILKKLFRFIGKAAGMNESEIASAMNEIQKGDSISFNEKIIEVNNCKIADEMWNICYALQSSLCSILNDEEIDSTSTATAMQESLNEFYTVAQESIKEWSSGKSANIVKKSEDFSEEDLEIMKLTVERLNERIEKSATALGNGNETNNNEKQKGDNKEMKIDKSKLTDSERAFVESLEKRYGTDEEANANNKGTETTPAEQTLVPAATTEPTVTKSITQTIDGTIPDSQTDDNENIYKGLHPAVKAELESLKKFREEAEDREFKEIAKKYAIIGKSEEELVPMLKGLKAAGGTAYNDMIAVLDQAVSTVDQTGLFSEIGKSGHGSNDEGSWAEAEAKATELMKSKTGLSKAQALDEVFIENPELAAKCEKED